MLYSTLLTGLFVAAAVAAPDNLIARQANCNRDNCLRAIAGRSTGTADCNTYFGGTGATVTSGIATSTAFATTGTTSTITRGRTTTTTVITTTVASPAAKVKRQAGSIPGYASACGGPSRYSSACSCLSATGSQVVASSTTTTTVTATTAITTVTVVSSTVTRTSTMTSTTAEVTPSPTFGFNLRIATSSNSILQGQIADTKLVPGFGNHIFFGDSGPTRYFLSTEGYLNDARGVYAVQQTGNDPIVQYTAPANSLRLKCNLGPGAATATSGTFTCSAPVTGGTTETLFNYCSETGDNNSGLFLTATGNSCPSVTLRWEKV